ncbi:transposase [Photorhabdus laumondii]
MINEFGKHLAVKLTPENTDKHQIIKALAKGLTEHLYGDTHTLNLKY